MMEGNYQQPKDTKDSVKPDGQELKESVSTDFMKEIIEEMGLEINDAQIEEFFG